MPGHASTLPTRVSRVALAQRLAVDLADRVLGQRLDEAHLSGDVHAREALADECLQRSALADATPRSTTNATGTSPRSACGAPTTQHGAHGGCWASAPLDQLGREVLATADDDVLDAAGDREVAVGIEAAEVARAQPSILHRLLASGADVALHQARPRDADLPLGEPAPPRRHAGLEERDPLPASTVPTVPKRRAPGGFIGRGAGRSDRPYETTSGTPKAASICFVQRDRDRREPQRRKRSVRAVRGPARCGRMRAYIVGTPVM
jgi:hypothetical protein